MNTRWAFYGLLLLAGLTGGAGDILLAQWAKVNRPIWMAAGLGVWGVCLVLFALLMRHGGRSLGVTFTLSAVVHMAVVLGWDLAMGETKATLAQWVGIALAVVGVVLIEAGQGGE